MKLKVQAHSLQPGDVVGSGEVVEAIQTVGVRIPTDKVRVRLKKNIPNEENYEFKDFSFRTVQWGKYTIINVERKDERGI